MVEQDAPYDPYIPSGQQGGQGQQQGGGNSRTQALQAVSFFSGDAIFFDVATVAKPPIWHVHGDGDLGV